MKTYFSLAVLICCTIMLQAQFPADEAELQAFAIKFEYAYNQGNLDAIQGMYTEHAVLIDQEGREMNGGAQIAAYFTRQFRDINATLSLNQSELNWSERENAWVTGGTFEVFSFIGKFGFDILEMSEYNNVMVQDNGQWKISRSVLHPTPPRSLSGKGAVIVDK